MRTGRKFLVVDDDLDLGEYIAATARQMGHACRYTAWVEELLAAHSDETDLLFLDLIMPEVDGVEVLRHLAARGCTTPIVLMSGVSRRVMQTAEELAEALGLTVAAKLQKPFTHSDLRGILQLSYVAPQRPAWARALDLKVTEAELTTALAEGQFHAFYQPQIEIATGRVCGVEALVRWQHPVAGLVYPDSFLPMLESMGGIDAMGWQVFRHALADLSLFSDAEGEVPMVSLNCTVGSLTDLRFPDRLLEVAAEFCVPADKITLEITESGLLREMDKTLDVLARLRMKGVQLSVDDFGTGYSMMRQLRHIPATEIKIDKFFVQHMDSGQGDRVIIQKTIEMGQELGLRVVAEGVETAEQLAFLRTARCDRAQGYLFSRPVPGGELQRWLKAHNTAPGNVANEGSAILHAA